MKTWQGRFSGSNSSLFEAFGSSILQDRVLAAYDVEVSKVHARALARGELITGEDCLELVLALGEIADEIEHGQLELKDELEDIHTHVENRLREKIGASADKLHSGRSRNDQIATDLRLYVLDHAHRCEDLILDVVSALTELASRYKTDIMPGYTHLQQAQPVMIAYPLLTYAQMLRRDHRRFEAAAHSARESPMGSGALAGSTFALDREFMAKDIGLGEPMAISLDAVSDRDFAVDFTFAAAMCMTHLSRMAEDLIIWSSQEFGFVEQPDAFSTGSSMMPQKKNPDAWELVRGRTALVVGDLMAMLSLIKALPLAYDKDLQDDKTPLFHAAATVEACLEVLAELIPDLQFNTHRCASALSSFAMATDLADELVRNGTPFREAHAIVGRLVNTCLEQGRQLGDLSVSELREAGADLHEVPDLSPEASVRRKATSGSTNPFEIEKLIESARAFVRERRPEAQA